MVSVNVSVQYHNYSREFAPTLPRGRPNMRRVARDPMGVAPPPPTSSEIHLVLLHRQLAPTARRPPMVEVTPCLAASPHIAGPPS
jgi:hypothetical protein